MPFADLIKCFLHCKVESHPFKYLYLLVGANPKTEGTYDPLIKLISKRLAYNRNKFVNLGIKVVLLNFRVKLNSYVLFIFHEDVGLGVEEVSGFVKMFPWGIEKRTKVVWVKRKDVCKAKRAAGLLVKDLNY